MSASLAWPDSVASKNKDGNRLFTQGKYQDAEKAYLEAQAAMPGRPEISYNLGNSLIKQQKYAQALQALHQSASKGNPGLKANGWYNAGNALFDMGKFAESAQAYVQALRLNPSDRDAKHNLELALRKVEEQKKAQQDQQKNQKKSEGNQDSRAGQQPQQNSDPQSSRSTPPEGAFTKERALQILDALKNQELAEQRKLLQGQTRGKVSARDW